MRIRNLKNTESNCIDMEIEHPDYGWAPFSASPTDSEPLGRDLYAQAIAGTLGAITPYVKPLAQAQTERLAIIEAAYIAANSAPISYMATTFQADAESQSLIAAVLTASSGALPAGFVWYDTNNLPVTMTFTQLQGLAGSILLRGQPLFVIKQTKKAAIRAALTVQQVEAVTW